MSKIVKARISPCPNCGQNGWWMELEPEVELSPEAKLRRDVARAVFEEANDIKRNRGLFGLFRRRLNDAAGPEPQPYEDPSPDHVRCATCGHEMSLAQSGHEPDSQHDWRIS